MAKQKRTYKLIAKIKDCKEVFKEGFEPGVVATQEIEFNEEPDQYDRPLFISNLIDHQHRFMKEQFSVLIEEVEETNNESQYPIIAFIEKYCTLNDNDVYIPNRGVLVTHQATGIVVNKISVDAPSGSILWVDDVGGARETHTVNSNPFIVRDIM